MCRPARCMRRSARCWASTGAPCSPTGGTCWSSSRWSRRPARSSGSAASAPAPGSCSWTAETESNRCSCRPRRPSRRFWPSTAGRSQYNNQGERVVAGQHLMQAESDIFLGWTRVPGPDKVDRDFYVRQLKDVEILGPDRGDDSLGHDGLRRRGWTLARARPRAAPGWPGRGAGMRRQCPELAARQCQEHVTMTAEPPQNPVTEAVRSLEVRWIFPGQLEAAVAGWFGRFPARTEAREDTYLLDPQLRGLSVKVRGGGALEVKVYRGSPGILEVAGRARGRLESWQKWSFPFSPLRQDSGDPAGGGRSARGGASAGSQGPAGRSWHPPRGWAASRGARWNSPRSAPVARTGGPWASRQPAPPICSAAHSRPPRRWCSPRPCPVVWNPARMNPGPTRSGWADGGGGSAVALISRPRA